MSKKAQCFTVHCKLFPGAFKTRPLKVSVHAYSKTEAHRLYKAKNFSMSGIIFSQNESCKQAHTNACECEKLIACSPDLVSHVPSQPTGHLDQLVLTKKMSPDRERVRNRMMDGQHFD